MKISVIGAGAMGGAIVEGLLKTNEYKTADITVADPYAPILDKFAQKGVSVTSDNHVAAEGADIVMVVVKPWLVENVLKDIKDSLDYSRQQLVLVAAGIKSEQVIAWMNKGEEGTLPFYLVIPNIAIAELQSMTFIVPVGATSVQCDTIKQIFDNMGESIITE
ncbi:MAG: NAD(P)-binding domain-containing protein, partial [Prevotella sp.]|nr:NAD(P)-binding domain-containing protein [Prevotella sp.]